MKGAGSFELLIEPDGLAQFRPDAERAIVMYQYPTPEIQRRDKQEEGCPSVDAVREAHDACGGRHEATGNTRDAKDAEVAVLPWIDEPLHAVSRGR